MLPQEKICRNIRNKILEGELRPGMRLPTHKELSLHYSVAIATVTRAVNRMKAEGLLECRRGCGTVIAAPRPPEVKADNCRIMVINPLNERINMTLSQAVNEVFIGTKWKVEMYCACANIAWYMNFLRECHNNPPAGLLLLPLSKKFFEFTPDLLPVPGTKTVIWGLPVSGIEADCISASPFGEGIVLGEYIVERGFRNIRYVSQGNFPAEEEIETIRGIGQVLQRHGVEFGMENVLQYPDAYSFGPSRDAERGAFEFIHQFRRTSSLPELFIAAHDGIAHGIFRALLSAGIKVPEQVSLLSAESGETEPFILHQNIRLNSFDNQYYLRTRIAAERLLSRLEGFDAPVRQYELLGHLKDGNSVRPVLKNTKIKEEIYQ